MKNTTKKGIIHFLVIRRGNSYLGICREFGFVEEGETSEEVTKRLINSSMLLLKTVSKNPRLEPSLNTSPPFKYLLFYYMAPFLSLIHQIIHKTDGGEEMRIFSKDLSSLSYA